MIKAINRIFRGPNLFMVFLAMYLMRWSIVRPILELLGFEPQMPESTFFLLVISTVLITAAGNVINDYHDVRADRLNNADNVVIDRYISRRQAIIIHFVLSSIGVVLGVFVAIYHHLYWLSPIFILTPPILWFYSTLFKHKILIGNLIVSIFTGMVPLLVILFEFPLILKANSEILQDFPNMFYPILYWVGMFAAFAFLTSLIREVLKDAEDIGGDAEVGSKTIAVVYGLKTSKILVFALLCIALTGLSLIFLIFLRDWMSLSYFGVFLALPLLYLLFQILRVNDSQGFHRLSQIVKLVMLTGLMYAPIAYFVMKVLF